MTHWNRLTKTSRNSMQNYRLIAGVKVSQQPRETQNVPNSQAIPREVLCWIRECEGRLSWEL